MPDSPLEALWWTGLVGLLTALRFSIRIGWNALYLGQHSLVPAIGFGRIVLLAARAAYPEIWSYVLVGLNSVQSQCLLLAVFVLMVELIVLKRVERPMLQRGPKAETFASFTRIAMPEDEDPET